MSRRRDKHERHNTMTCDNCTKPERRTPWRVRLSYFSTQTRPLWTVFRYDETHQGAGHSGYFAVHSFTTWGQACDYLKEIA